jgi:hypothetical protein
MKRIVCLSSISPVILALLLCLASTGCKNTQPAANSSDQNAGTPAAAAPGQAAAPSTAAAPQSAAAPASSAPAPKGTPQKAAQPKPQPVTLTVDAGHDISVRINETINAKTANVGDPFTGELTAALTTKTGETVFPKGTNVSGTVVSSKGQGRFAGAGVLAIELKEVGGHAVTATEYVVSQKGKGKRSATLIGGGAALGALIGGLAGGGKGAAIGGVTGAGAGTAGSAMTGNKQLVIPTESIVSFELSQPISITVQK